MGELGLTARYVRSTNAGVAAPVEDGQEDHVEGVGAQIGGDGEVGVEGGRAQLLLHEGEVGRLPAHDGEQGIADLVAPGRQTSGICRSMVSDLCGGRGRGRAGRTVQWSWCLLPASSRGSWAAVAAVAWTPATGVNAGAGADAGAGAGAALSSRREPI